MSADPPPLASYVGSTDSLVRDLRDVATGKIAHVFAGACPDEIEGADVRDPTCPACRIIMAADATFGVNPVGNTDAVKLLASIEAMLRELCPWLEDDGLRKHASIFIFGSHVRNAVEKLQPQVLRLVENQESVAKAPETVIGVGKFSNPRWVHRWYSNDGGLFHTLCGSLRLKRDDVLEVSNGIQKCELCFPPEASDQA